MSKSIDQKIVEMQFDNKDFEKNVATSMGTIDKLKEKLNFDDVGNSFQDLEKSSSKVNFSSLKDGLDTVTGKFSALEIAGITALSNLTNKAVDAGVQFVKSLSLDQVSAGFQKFSDKTSNVATLVAQGYDLETVNEQMERLNWFTDETSYEFTEMVANIAKFTATGQGLEDSVTAMEGIASWAALSGQNAQTASRAMYQLSQAMGAGAMRKEDYKSIQNASMDTQEFRQHALDAAVALGTLQKNADDTYTAIGDLAKKNVTFTKEQFTEGLTEGMWFTKDVMMKVFNEYSSAVNDIYEISQETGMTASEVMEEFGDQFDEFGLKAFKAGQEARTFRDAVDSIKDAVSTGFMNTFELIFGDYEDAKNLWTDIANAAYDVFAEPVNEFNDKLESALYTGMYSTEAFTDSAQAYLDYNGDALQSVADVFNDFEHTTAREIGKKLGLTGTNIEMIATRLQNYEQGSDELNQYLDNFAGEDKELRAALEEFVQTYGSGFVTESQVMYVLSEQTGIAKEEIEKLYSLVNDEGLDSENVQEYIDAISNGDEKTKQFVTDIVKGTTEVTQAATGRQNLLDAFWQLWDNIATIIERVKKAFHNVFPEKQWTTMYGITVKIKDVITKLMPSDETLDKIQSFLEGVFTIFKEIGEVFKTVFGAIKDGLSKIFGKKEDGTGGPLDALANWGESVKEGFDDFVNGGFMTGLSNALSWIVEKLSGFAQTIAGWFTTIKDKIVDFFTGKHFARFSEDLGDSLDIDQDGKLTKTLVSRLDIIKEKFEAFKEWLGNIVQKIRDFFQKPIIPKKTDEEDGTEETISRLDWFKEKFDAFKTWFSDTVEKIKTFFGNLKQAIVDSGIPEALSNVWEKIKEKFEGIKDTFTNFFSGLGQTDTSGKDTILSEVNGLADEIQKTTVFDVIRNTLEGIKTTIQNVWETVKPVVEPIFEKLKEWFGAIKEFLANLDWGQISTVIGEIVKAFLEFKAVGFIKDYVGSVKGLVDSIKNFVVNASGVVEGFKNVFTGLGDALEGFAKKMKSEGIASIIKSIGLAVLEIAAAIYIITTVDQDMLLAAAGIIGTILGAIESLVIVLEKSSSQVGFLDKSKSQRVGIAAEIIALATAVLEIAAAIKLIAEIGDVGTILAASAAASAILGELAGLAYFLNKFVGGTDIKSAIGIALMMSSLSGAVKDTAKAIAEVAAVGDPYAIAAAAAALALMMGEIAGLITYMNKAATGGSYENAAMLIGMGILIKELATTLSVLGDMSWEQIAKGIVALTLIIGDIILMTKTEVDGKKMVAFGGAMLEVAVAMLALGLFMKQMEKIDWETIGKSVVAFGAIAGGLAAIMFIPFDGKKAVAFAGAMDLVSVAMLLMLPVIKAFAEMQEDEYARALIAVTVLTAVMGGLAALMGTFGSSKSLMAGGGLALAALAVLELAGALAILAEVAPKLAEGAPKIAEAIVTVSGIFVTAIPDIVGKLADSLAIALPKLIEMIVTLIKAACTGVLESLDTIISTILEIIFKVLDAVGENIGPIIEKIIGIVVGAIQGVANGAAEIVMALVELFKSIFDALSEAFGGDLDIEKVLEGVAVLSALFVAMTLITVMALEALATIAILNQIAEELNVFIEKIQPFIKACEKIDPASMEGAKILAETILLLTAASILEGLTSWLTGGVDYGKFADGLNEMAPSIKAFADEMEGVDGENLKNAAQAALYLTEFVNNLPRSGGLLQSIIGETTDMKSFADGLIELAPSLVTYANEVKQLTEQDIMAIQESIKAVKALADMANSLPRHGGLWQKIIGEAQSMEEFAKDLVTMPPALIEYATEAKTLTEEDYNAIMASIPPVKALAEMADCMPRHGGLWQTIIGEAQSMSDFAEDLVDLAGGLRKYAAEVVQLTPMEIAAISASVAVASALVDISNTLDPTGGIAAWFTGETNFEKFAGDIEWLGKGIKGYSDAIKGAAFKRVNDSVEAAQSLVTIANSLDPTGGIVSWFTGDNDLESFGKNVEAFGTSLKKYSDNVKDIDPAAIVLSDSACAIIINILTSIKNAKGDLDTNAIKDFGKALEEFGKSIKAFTNTMKEIISSDIDNAANDISDLMTAINEIPTDAITKTESLGQSLARLGEDGVKKFIQEIDGAGDRARTAGASLMQNLIDGAEGKTESMKTAATNLSNAVITKFNSLVSEYEETGQKIVLDIANGINNANKVSDNLDPIGAYAESLKTTFEAKLESIDFNAIGQAVCSDFAGAITEYANNVEASFAAIEVALENGSNSIKTYYEVFVSAGHFLIDGFVKGIDEKAGDVEKSAKALGSKAFTALTEALDENSPSKLTYQAGQYFVAGFANGLSDNVDVVEDSVNYISEQTMDKMSKLIAGLGSQLDEDIENNLTITPVLDLTQFEEGTRTMNRYLSNMTTARVGAAAASESYANSVAAGSARDEFMDKALAAIGNSEAGESINNNNFYIQSNDPTEVANEVSRILQKQVERRNSVWE